MTDNERLSRELRTRADQAGGHPISFDDVKRSATKMKWQQRAAAGGVALAVLAIAIPVGFEVSNDDNGNGRPPIATSSPTVATPSPSATPADGKRVELTANVEEHSGEPRVPYWFDGAITLPTGAQVTTPAPFSTFATLGDGYVGLAVDEGSAFVYFIDADGTVTQKVETASYSLAVSPDGSQVAYTDKDSKLFVAWDGRGSPRQLDTNGLAPVEPVAVQGSGPCVDPEVEAGNSCAVYWTSDGTSYLSSAHGIVESLDPILSVNGVSADGHLAGMISVADDGSCSAVFDENRTKLWETCDYSLGKFSPDGRFVIGRPAYLDGVGDSTVAILDAETGDLVVDYSRVNEAFVNNTVWESDSTLLATVHDEGWAIMRLAIDGSLTSSSTGRIPGEFDATPVFFEVQP